LHPVRVQRDDWCFADHSWKHLNSLSFFVVSDVTSARGDCKRVGVRG
jgi:hypothetical protein